MKLNVLKPFNWSHRGVEFKAYAKGDVIDTDEHADGDELATVALVEEWVEESEDAGKGRKAKGVAPENK